MLGCVGSDRRDWRMPGATARLVVASLGANGQGAVYDCAYGRVGAHQSTLSSAARGGQMHHAGSSGAK